MSLDVTAFLLGLPAIGSAGSSFPVTSAWNPADKNAAISLSAGNYVATGTSSLQGVRGVQSHSTGKWHLEITPTFSAGTEGVGASNSTASLSSGPGGAGAMGWQPGGSFFVNGVNGGAQATYTTGQVLAMEFDLALSQVFLQVAGGSRSVGLSISAITASPIFPMFISGVGGAAGFLNTGQQAFAVAPTSGFAAWG